METTYYAEEHCRVEFYVWGKLGPKYGVRNKYHIVFRGFNGKLSRLKNNLADIFVAWLAISKLRMRHNSTEKGIPDDKNL